MCGDDPDNFSFKRCGDDQQKNVEKTQIILFFKCVEMTQVILVLKGVEMTNKKRGEDPYNFFFLNVWRRRK